MDKIEYNYHARDEGFWLHVADHRHARKVHQSDTVLIIVDQGIR